jgi:hypothetical protein
MKNFEISIVIWFFHTSVLSRYGVNLAEFLRKYTLRKVEVQNQVGILNFKVA